MSDYHLSPRAQADVAGVVAYLDARNPDAAVRWFDKVDARCRALAATPESGRRRDELAPGLRSSVVDRWLILYRIKDEGIEIARILHGAMDLANQVYD